MSEISLVTIDVKIEPNLLDGIMFCRSQRTYRLIGKYSL